MCQKCGGIAVKSRSLSDITYSLVAPRYNYGVPRNAIPNVQEDGGLVLEHEHNDLGMLDRHYAEKTLEYLHEMRRVGWRAALWPWSHLERDALTPSQFEIGIKGLGLCRVGRSSPGREPLTCARQFSSTPSPSTTWHMRCLDLLCGL
jgi:hypothetical protein